MPNSTYYQYSTGQSRVSIPKTLADALGWEHKCTINIELKTIDGKMGLFLTKDEGAED